MLSNDNNEHKQPPNEHHNDTIVDNVSHSNEEQTLAHTLHCIKPNQAAFMDKNNNRHPPP